MPPKKTYTKDSPATTNSTSSRIRSNVASDLITKSQAALSSQASIYTQRTQGSQQANHNFANIQNEDMQFNREQMTEVVITKEEEQIIQKILQMARKGKVNSKNAFNIPIKVANSEVNFSVNNKFWKFASELLSASMSIYDKRVQNMYISTGQFQSKLSRIGFDIKNRKMGQQDQDRHDDVHLDEESRRNKSKQERQQLLKISVEDFSGALNLDDENIIGFQSLDKKDKLDIKNVQHKFIADPTFARTQKLFDSFSLKSLMLNIFQISNNLDVRIFYKSDLEWQKLQGYDSTQILNMSQNDTQNIGNQSKQEEEDEKSNTNLSSQQNSVKQETITNKITNIIQNPSLPSYMLKHLQVSRTLLKQNIYLPEINDFIGKQPELKQDYLARMQNFQVQNSGKRHNSENQEEESIINLPYPQIIEKQRNQFIQLFKEFHESFDQDLGVHHFAEIQNGQGLFETHETQSQSFDQVNSFQFSGDFRNNQNSDTSEANSMPVSFQDSFYGWDQKNNIIEPIMPWEIQFKNLKLTKKRKPGVINRKKGSKKSSKQQVSIVDFQLTVLDRKQVLMQKDIKKRFQNSKQNKRFVQKKVVGKQFDVAHNQYHTKFDLHSTFSQNIAKSLQKKNPNSKQKHDNSSEPNFVFDLNQNTDPQYENKVKQQYDNAEEQTRLIQSQNYQHNQEDYNGFISNDKITKNTSFIGNQMGVNNIREIKKMIVNQVHERGKASLEHMNKILVNLSPQQLFTIFLHLTNEHQFQIRNEDPQETTIVLFMAERSKNMARGGRNVMVELEQIQI